MKTDEPRELLRAWRGDRTLIQAAPSLDCNPSTLSLIETGKRQPGLALAIRIRDVVGIPVEAWGEAKAERAAS